MSFDEIKKTLIEVLVPLGAERISLFGSFARGEATDKSDIDVLVRLLPASKRKPIGLLWFSLDEELAARLGRRVDLVTELSLPEPFRARIQRDLVVIYEQAG